MKHLWIIKKDSSTMLYYYPFYNPPFKAFLVSGLLAALNSFSEYEIEDQGIQSLDMKDLRWVYLKSDKNNLLLIAAADRARNSEIIRSQLAVICDQFIHKYSITPQDWKSDAIDISKFETFDTDLMTLKEQWEWADKYTDVGEIFDILGLFQQLFFILIDIINSNFKDEKYNNILDELYLYTPQMHEFYQQQNRPESFTVLQLFIPQIDLKNKKIIFNQSSGTNLLGTNPMGLEPEVLLPVFYLIIKHFKITITAWIDQDLWFRILSTKIIPFLLSKWEFLENTDILKELMKIFYSITPFNE